MEINFVQRKESVIDVITVRCKIKHLVIPTDTVDSGANFPIMSEDISKRSKLEIDTKEKHDLRGIATRSEEHTSELQSQSNLVCRLLLEKKKKIKKLNLQNKHENFTYLTYKNS